MCKKQKIGRVAIKERNKIRRTVPVALDLCIKERMIVGGLESLVQKKSHKYKKVRVYFLKGAIISCSLFSKFNQGRSQIHGL